MNNTGKEKKSDFDDDDWFSNSDTEDHNNDAFENEEDDSDEESDYSEPEPLQEKLERSTRQLRKASRKLHRLNPGRSVRTRRAPLPPRPPLPPMPPLPPGVEVLRSEKVIGIRGLDERLYREISRIAKKNGVSVAELINPLLAKYRFDSGSENGSTISNIKTLELNNEELVNLDDEIINLVNIKNLLLGPDITIETFKKIKKIEQINKIWVPSHLYLQVLKKAKHCKNIEKYKGDHLPLVLQKNFDSDVHLTKTFFEYFLESEEMVDLTVGGELRIDDDISISDFKQVIYSLQVDGDIHAPRHLIGYLFAKAECYGEIEESNG
ncbi:MAG: hypothetical protein ACXAC6_02435 [Candidatus Hodarchaeales archaeon]|jgi:hypothetical protein